MELRTLAQVCLDFFGQSKLAEAINAGIDPHLVLGAKLAGVTVSDAEAFYACDPEWSPRQIAKAPNFGYPGGLGWRTYIEFAKGYGLEIGEAEAKEHKAAWLATWPEMWLYFEHVSALCRTETREAVQVKQVRSGRLHGRVRYTAACNGYFQGLGADLTGDQWYRIARACYSEPRNALFGSRIVNYIHDEFILEVDDDADRLTEAGQALSRIMIETSRDWIPDVPFTKIKPCAMRYWSKKAKPKHDENGRLVPWEG
jgi:DNA polymerase I-like protein with 3'-5' exonuclease and polymerase domains